MTFAARCGWSSDLSGPVTDRALFHADNCYWLPAVELRSLPLKTNTVSNTAFRGFGGPQGMVGGERVLEEIAFAVGLDPLEVSKRNFYGQGERNTHAEAGRRGRVEAGHRRNGDRGRARCCVRRRRGRHRRATDARGAQREPCSD